MKEKQRRRSAERKRTNPLPCEAPQLHLVPSVHSALFPDLVDANGPRGTQSAIGGAHKTFVVAVLRTRREIAFLCRLLACLLGANFMNESIWREKIRMGNSRQFSFIRSGALHSKIFVLISRLRFVCLEDYVGYCS